MEQLENGFEVPRKVEENVKPNLKKIEGNKKTEETDEGPTSDRRAECGERYSGSSDQFPVRPKLPMQIPQLFPPRFPPPPPFLNRPGSVQFPLIFLSPIGAINVILKDEVIVMIAINKTMRVCCGGKFSVASSDASSAIMHPDASILHQKDSVFANFSSGEKRAVFGTEGIIFTMRNLSDAHMMGADGVRTIPSSQVEFDAMETDQTLSLFYRASEYGVAMVPFCHQIVQSAIYESRPDQVISIQINGIHIRQDRNGDVQVNCRPRQIRVSPKENTVSVQCQRIEIAIQNDEKALVKHGDKRVHVSRSGMVVNDGKNSVLMDHFGRVLSG